MYTVFYLRGVGKCDRVYKESNIWSRVRVVERTSLLKRQGVITLAGSNPADSAVCNAVKTAESSEISAYFTCGIRKHFPYECTHEWKRCTEAVSFESRRLRSL